MLDTIFDTVMMVSISIIAAGAALLMVLVMATFPYKEWWLQVFG